MAKPPASPPRPCPCCSGATYEACCAPYHRGDREPPDAVALMRSRYSAFALGEAEHLTRTLDASHPDHGTPTAELARLLRAQKSRRRYPRLVILDSRTRGRTAEVLFLAGVTEGGQDVSFVELSDFAHDGRGFRYASGVLLARAELGRDPEGLTIDEFLALAGR